MNLPHFEEKKTGPLETKNRSRLWVYNYNFEFELAGESRRYRDHFPFHPWYFLNRSWHVLLPLAAASDEILVYERPHPLVVDALQEKTGFLPDFLTAEIERESNAVFDDFGKKGFGLGLQRQRHLCPWGWSPTAASIGKSVGCWGTDEIDLQTIRWVNDKTTSHQLRQNWLPSAFQIPGKTITATDSTAEKPASVVTGFLKQNGTSFVKHPFGTAGRLSDLCNTGDFSDRKVRKWKNWIQKAGGILLEKSVSIRQEWSVQVQFETSGIVLPIALTRLFSGPNGNYLGTIILESDRHMLDNHLESLAPVIREIGKNGYIGPLGIDLIETMDGSFKLLEINGRLTMGRVAYEWHRLLAGWPASLFANIFIQAGGIYDDLALYERTMGLMQHSEPGNTLLNLVADKVGNMVMVSLLIQGYEPETLLETLNRMKSGLKKEFKQA